jgi:apolipoprotein N-acyltransferase
MRRLRSGWRGSAGIIASVALSALLLGLYVRGGPGFALGFVALVPWLLALNATRTAAGAARSGWCMAMAFVVAAFAWFAFAVASFTGLAKPAALLLLVAIAPLFQPQVIVFALVRHAVGRHHGPVVRALAGASAWVAAEWLLPKLLGDTLGHGVYPSRVLRQVADVGGAAGITFLLILVNECVAFAIERRRDAARAFAPPLAAAACVLALMAGYGAVRLSTLAATPAAAEKPLRVGMVQSNIVDYERLRREMGAYEVVRHVLDTHYAMSREAVDTHRVDALLWSETVYPTTYGHPKSEDGAALDREVQDFVTAAGVPLVMGTYDLDAAGEYNAAAFLEPVPTQLHFYRKTNLFLFTEYIPRWLDGPTIRGWLPWAGAWRPGDGARVYPLRLADGREIPVLPMICLDDVDTGLAIDGARLGAQAILGMSNDSWFTEHRMGANLHLTVAAFRSIETRLPQLRVTSNGMSAVIDANGDVVAATAMGEQKLLIGEVPLRQPVSTLMLAWGDWVGRAGAVVLLLLAMSAAVKTWQRRTTRGAQAPSASASIQQQFRADAAVLSPLWRAAAGVLRVFARGSLLWMGVAALLQHSSQTNSLSQIQMFAGLFLAPEFAAWCIERAFAATARIVDGALVLEQRERRIEIDAKEISTVECWALPMPSTGVWLTLESGRRWSNGIALRDPAALVDALIRAGARPALAESLTGRVAAYAQARASVARRWIDHPALKFVLFPLIPALPAFRLHQHIAYGGTFGEYHTFGLQAYLTAFGIWWASWAIGLMLFAAALRTAIEAGTMLTVALRRGPAAGIRQWLEFLGRLLFYVGVPAAFLIRFLPW